MINLEISAQKFKNKVLSINDRKKSIPPIKIINPIVTTICIKSFFFFGNLIEKYEKIKIDKPSKDGINEVTDSLSLIKLTNKPQKNRKIP